MTGTYTKGPWKLHLVDDCTVIDAGGRPVATVAAELEDALDYNRPEDWPVMEANARLIAAAPELLEALKGAIEWMACVEPHLRDGQPFQRNLEIYKAAIAKAEGRS